MSGFIAYVGLTGGAIGVAFGLYLALKTIKLI